MGASIAFRARSRERRGRRRGAAIAAHTPGRRRCWRRTWGRGTKPAAPCWNYLLW